MISMKKLRFSSRPRTKVRRHGPPDSARAQPWPSFCETKIPVRTSLHFLTFAGKSDGTSPPRFVGKTPGYQVRKLNRHGLRFYFNGGGENKNFKFFPLENIFDWDARFYTRLL